LPDKMPNQDLLKFMPDPVNDLNPDQLRSYNFYQSKIKQFKILKRAAADPDRVEEVIEAYRTEAKKLLEA